jgi:outer membrane protein assembly factor BamB
MHKRSFLVLMTSLALTLPGCSAQALPADDLENNLTSTPISSPARNGTILLARGNAQRTGVYDFPAVREPPSVVWQVQVSASSWLMPPLLADEILYTGSGDGVLYALNAETGEQLWSEDGFEALESTGAVGGDLIVTAGFSQLVKAMDRKSGEERWSFQTEFGVQGAPLIVDQRVFIATDRRVYALDL